MFVIQDPKHFLVSLKELGSKTPKTGKFYAALESYLKDRTYDLIQAKECLDFGSIVNFYASKKNLINRRFVNEIAIDESKTRLTKVDQNCNLKSTHILKSITFLIRQD